MREDWKYCNFSEVFPIVMGKTPARADNSLWDKKKETHNLWVSIADISNNEGREITDTEEYVSDKASSKMRLIAKGSLLMSFKLTIGKMAFAGDDLFTNEAIIAIPDNGKYNLRFLYYYLSDYNWSTLTDGAEKVKGKTLNKTSIGKILLPIISLSEQERIVSLLDEQFAKIDALKANAASQLQAAKDLFQSALKEMLTPQEGWEEKKIGDICEVTDFVANGSFATLRENVKYHNEPNYAVLVRLADYSSNFDKSKFVYVDKHSYDFLSKSSLNGGEIIMSNVGSIGKCFICPDLGMPMTIGPNSLLIKTPYSQFFIYYFKNITFQEKLKTITAQTTLSKFNKTQFRELTIPIPSLPEQERIAARLDAISEKVKALQANYDQTITLCNDLKQALLKSIFA